MSYQKSGTEKDALSNLNAQPSPASTNQPSEYGSLLANSNNNNDSGVIQMPSNSNPNLTGFVNDEEEVIDDNKRRAKNRRPMMMMKGGLAILLGAVVWMAWVVKKSSNNNNNSGPVATNSVHEQHGFISRAASTLSHKHPVHDLNIPLFERPDFSVPNPALFGNNNAAMTMALPTNAWYQNLLLPMGNSKSTQPSEEQRVYPVPYLVDVVGPIPGLRLHHPNVIASDHVVQVVQVLSHGLTVGASTRAHFMGRATADDALTNEYEISKMTPLGITLEWVGWLLLLLVLL